MWDVIEKKKELFQGLRFEQVGDLGSIKWDQETLLGADWGIQFGAYYIWTDY